MKNVKNGYVSKYLDDAFLFIKTLVFKVTDLASLMNEEVVRVAGAEAVDVDQPETWKYYMNISGNYHFTDQQMRVVSIDTLQEILFTKENLQVHTATAEAYSYGTRDYFALVNKYPKQVRLINGILNPVSIQEAIAAKDGKILAYRKDLIEVNEITLLEELQKAIERMMFRWYNTQFNISSPIYAATILTQLQMQLLPKFLNLRWKRCHTIEVHSFHVRMFLASHGELDRYLPYLTLHQSLWLYRNVRYIERNSGRSEQFATLIEKLLTNRRIPIGGYSVRQIDEFEDYQPKVVARLNPLNAKVNALRDDVQAITEIYDREVLMTPGNEDYLKHNQEKSILQLRRSPSTAIQTKALHSSMTDLTNSVPETFEAVAIRQWCHMANNDLYDAYVVFKDPKSSIVYSLKALDAFIYMYYVLLMAEGFTVAQLPNYLNLQQRKTPKPTVSDLMKVVDTQKHDLLAIAQDLVARQPAITPCLSVSSFHTLVSSLYEECYRHWFIISSMEDYYERAMVENMTRCLFEDERTVLKVNSGSMDSWLFEKNLPLYDYSHNEAMALVVSIYQAAVGVKNNGLTKLSNIQKAILSLVEELSSYSIQITREINETDMVLLNWPAVRTGNSSQSQSDSSYNKAEVLVNETGGSGVASVAVDQIDGSIVRESAEPIMVPSSLSLDPVSDQWLYSTMSLSSDDTASVSTLEVTYAGQNEVVDSNHGVIGYSLLDSLTEEQFSSLKSIYQ